MEQIAILVVDDEKEIADLLEIYLISDGFHVLKAYNAQEGLKILDRQKVDLVIQIIKEECSRRKEMLINPTYSAGTKGPVLGYSAPPVTIDVGGATVFIVNVESYMKL